FFSAFNQVILLGRVGNNPETRGTEANPVVTFSLATNINYSKDNEVMQQTDWHRITVFKPHLRDKVSRYMAKGARVMVNGRISYFDRKDSANPNIIYKNASVIADDVIFFAR
ncbi:UNVERIFIED_CONTAM: hypothetical protein GTU68_021973, partial [Idotea baltica]|nr:hypothetical protein [Idotea baltica]